MNGKKQIITLEIEAKRSAMSKDFLAFGIMPAPSLKAPTAKDFKDAGEADLDDKTLDMMLAPDMRAIKPGEAIVAVDGKPVDPANDEAFLVLDQAVQQSNGKPVPVTVAADEGKGARREIRVQPHFMEPFGEDSLNFGGMVPRMQVVDVPKDSPSFGKLLPGDVITRVSTNAGGAACRAERPQHQAVPPADERRRQGRFGD